MLAGGLIVFISAILTIQLGRAGQLEEESCIHVENITKCGGIRFENETFTTSSRLKYRNISRAKLIHFAEKTHRLVESKSSAQRLTSQAGPDWTEPEERPQRQQWRTPELNDTEKRGRRPIIRNKREAMTLTLSEKIVKLEEKMTVLGSGSQDCEVERRESILKTGEKRPHITNYQISQYFNSIKLIQYFLSHASMKDHKNYYTISQGLSQSLKCYSNAGQVLIRSVQSRNWFEYLKNFDDKSFALTDMTLYSSPRTHRIVVKFDYPTSRAFSKQTGQTILDRITDYHQLERADIEDLMNRNRNQTGEYIQFLLLGKTKVKTNHQLLEDEKLVCLKSRTVTTINRGVLKEKVAKAVEDQNNLDSLLKTNFAKRTMDLFKSCGIDLSQEPDVGIQERTEKIRECQYQPNVGQRSKRFSLSLLGNNGVTEEAFNEAIRNDNDNFRKITENFRTMQDELIKVRSGQSLLLREATIQEDQEDGDFWTILGLTFALDVGELGARIRNIEEQMEVLVRQSLDELKDLQDEIFRDTQEAVGNKEIEVMVQDERVTITKKVAGLRSELTFYVNCFVRKIGERLMIQNVDQKQVLNVDMKKLRVYYENDRNQRHSSHYSCLVRSNKCKAYELNVISNDTRSDKIKIVTTRAGGHKIQCIEETTIIIRGVETKCSLEPIDLYYPSYVKEGNERFQIYRATLKAYDIPRYQESSDRVFLSRLSENIKENFIQQVAEPAGSLLEEAWSALQNNTYNVHHVSSTLGLAAGIATTAAATGTIFLCCRCCGLCACGSCGSLAACDCSKDDDKDDRDDKDKEKKKKRRKEPKEKFCEGPNCIPQRYKSDKTKRCKKPGCKKVKPEHREYMLGGDRCPLPPKEDQERDSSPEINLEEKKFLARFQKKKAKNPKRDSQLSYV